MKMEKMTDDERIMKKIAEQIKMCEEEDSDWIFITVWMGKRILNVLKEHKWMGNENRCVCCGTIIPEGRQVCPQCERTPVRPIKNGRVWECGACREILGIVGDDRLDKYCRTCGRKADWAH